MVRGYLTRKTPRKITLPESMMADHATQFGAAFDADGTQLLFAIRALALQINERANAWLAPFGLTAKTLNYLASLHGLGNADVTLKELSTLTHSSNAGVTQTIDSLERDGLVVRKPNRDDGRSMVVKLTAKGKRRFEQAFRVHLKAIAHAASAVSDRDRAGLLASLVAISAALDNPPAS